MFYDLYLELCKERNVSPTRAAIEIGISKATPTTWKKRGLTPQGETLNKIAAYFGVSTDYLLGNVSDPLFHLDNDRILQDINSYEDESTSTLTDRDRRDIARDLERIMEALDTAGDLQFDGDPMSDEARESIRAAMKLGLEAAKVKNKERFTPKKFRKE